MMYLRWLPTVRTALIAPSFSHLRQVATLGVTYFGTLTPVIVVVAIVTGFWFVCRFEEVFCY
ncbi:hypothetical protein AmaxDRAFT_1341 [Limnospira maxima CS-328]|uniref:Uncharacterized protein n=2 Tax=Limnospira TaxID=2596745 RepID=A0A9P1NWH1_9CYAN|nr:hypothetical protein AmaxDRAFT_1341 [Limnospira maxima CS-328]UWU51356.1 hypothetical protein APLC1_6316 [Arthrospira platensis C1]CDM92517.1 conserved protein of unknown function [Limnospira indica PCC 8005]